MYQIKKRSGELELFELSKIKSAIKRTFDSCNRNYQESIIETISLKAVADAETKIKDNVLNVEDIQDSVEKVLMTYGYEDVAKAYILYRKQHERVRNAKETLINYKKTVESYKDRDDWRVKENSTVTYSLGGLILNNSGAMIANYWLSEIYDDEIANAHRNCDIHLHDLSYLSAYCAGWSLKQLIQEGLGGVPGKISSDPASHLSTLCNQMVNFIGCFTDDTRIVLSDGTTPTIRQLIDSGETEWTVKSYDPNTNQVIDSKMDNLHKTRTVDTYLELQFEDGDIVKCTLDHKFYTYNRGWVEAKDLTEQDDVANLDYNKYIVYKITNKMTGQFYIGSHITTNKNDGYMGSGSKISEQVNTFGKDCFTKEILDEVYDSETLRKTELFYIHKYKNNPLLLNKVRHMNHGFDNINSYTRFPDQLKGILVSKDGIGIYVRPGSLNIFLSNGYTRSDAGSVSVPDTTVQSSRMLGKTQSESTRQLMSRSLAKNKVERGKHISDGINKVGEDGLTSAQRTQRRIGKDGLTHHQRVMKKQVENRTNNFIKNNPNYIICENGYSIPHNTNMKRVNNNTHNFQVTTNMGCHNKTLPKRISQIMEFFNTEDWDISQNTFKAFCNKYPDWTGKFNYSGFLYTIRKAIERNNLHVNIVGGVL